MRPVTTRADGATHRDAMLICAGLHGATAIGLGAYAAHGMEASFGVQAAEWSETAAFYQLVHAAALVPIALIRHWSSDPSFRRALAVAGWAFAVGAALFAGALYGLAFTGVGAFGRMAPVGGLAMLIGWISVAAAGGMAWFRRGREPQ